MIEPSNKIHIGGCWGLPSPNDPAFDCECYKVEFLACHHLRVYHITMCRNWITYMAQRVKDAHIYYGNTPPKNRVVQDAIERHFDFEDHWFEWHCHERRKMRKADAELVGRFGAIPTHFPEVVMDNPFGRIMQMIPLADMFEIDDRFAFRAPLPMWTGGHKQMRRFVEDNRNKLRHFWAAVERLGSKSEPCRRHGIHTVIQRNAAAIEVLRTLTNAA